MQDRWFDPFVIRVPHIKDKDLPVISGGQFASSTAKGVGYWLYGGYTFRKHGDDAQKGAPMTWFARYEFADPNTQTADNANRRLATGFVIPINHCQALIDMMGR